MIGEILNAMTEEGWLDCESGEAASELLRRVEAAACGPDGQWAQIELSGAKHEGMRRRWLRHTKSATATFIDASTGRVNSIPARIGVAVRRADGTRTGAFQHRMLHEISWGQLETALQDEVRRQAASTERVEVLALCLSLRAKYPQAATPREAWILSGGDPEDLDQALAI